MINFEVSKLRDQLNRSKLEYPNIDFSIDGQFYYDETNNIRKFYLKESGFNYDFIPNFILGGIMHEGDTPDVKELFSSFSLKNRAKEVKFKQIANGNFTDCLKSKNLSLFFKFILNSKLFVHYSSLNFLYWSIADIVDSAVRNAPDLFKRNKELVFTLKNDLYQIVKQETESFRKLFFNYGYPNIKKHELNDFINDFIQLLESYEGKIEYHGSIQSLIILLESSIQKELVFIMNNKDNILIDSLSNFYLKPIYTFLNSNHIFDNEEEIKKTISKFNITSDGEPVKNYSFVDSKDNTLVQLSDIFVGIVGKFMGYRNSHSIEEIFSDIDKFSDIQRENLFDFFKLIIRSHVKNQGLILNNDSLEEIAKFDQILSYLQPYNIKYILKKRGTC
ncbi:hypothetical protein EG359_06315 [Chryseobacterium joostei]|uniref:DUF3800 domain-containing protein n=1 Tax=Chryseobacterium joostei TaxID=112234 RepID=A0A1N7HSN5_9FLAO|nr:MULTISPECIES: DUF3800 domain-containing protein [Chryseobacterium]AZA77055.1 hypothetical protein EG347_05820 [Chryseobacterium sp. G0186]AZA99241.1 hypothetical protein EG359_06315 [Chryseobacterium joostei]SIS27833.1 hypothetical protein SAMN05421768_10193 [Chryseobacterium joostei]